MKLGLLEFGTGCISPLDIVENVLIYAEKAETLGFTRFWLAEHYGASPAYCNPEALVPIIAGLTSRIKVGVAGLLMAYHNPFRVASAFKLLNNLFPGRIDLGLAKGRVPGEIGAYLSPDLDVSDPAVWSDTLRRNLNDLVAYLTADGHAGLITPRTGYTPELWTLASGLNNIEAAVQLDTALCKSLFHHRIDDPIREAETLLQYREAYYQKHKKRPVVNLAVAGICAESGREARRIRESLSRPAATYNELIGPPEFIRDELFKLGELYGVDEFIFLNLAEKTSQKLKGITLLARTFSTAVNPVFTPLTEAV
ncbi:LLM class flavin-dependent oxidoreductase [Larkinella soli]|uniref:LLM class flavin-dependent oxidoreductase n=1 Tax=Larkinella soli TaxID=1770527 RepID=UPI000FFC06FB|nr:LLM class flavin-dependent oxidoreductase [Larkinella soli]